MNGKKYRVTVDGVPAKLEEIRVSAHPFNRIWPGKQRDISQSEVAYMLRLFGDEPVAISIFTDEDVKEAVVRPLSKGVIPNASGNTVSFVLKENGKYSAEINGSHFAIHIFYVKEERYENDGAATYRFGPGHHNVGLLRLYDGESVYIHKNAVVHGSIYAVDARDIKIYGQGVLDAGWEQRTEKNGDLGWDGENCFSPELVHTYGGIRMFRCKNVRLQGITVTDPASYAISFWATDAICVDSVNVVGLWKYNTDGIDFVNSRNIQVMDCFIRSFDDCMCLKGITAFSDMSVENVRISKCVFWCDWGKNIEIGLASACREITDVVWEDCDIIHGNGSVITISNGQWADIHDIQYRNIRVEYAYGTEPMVLQENDEQVYRTDGTTAVPALIFITDRRRNWQGNISFDDAKTKIRNISVADVQVFMDERIRKKPEMIIRKETDSSVFENIDIGKILLNGNEVSLS